MNGVQPIEILHERDHAFVKPDVKPPRGAGRCGVCGQAKTNIVHLGAPQSLNVAGSGGNHFAYQNAKKAWEKVFTDLITAQGMPVGLAHVLVEGRVCFPDRIRRDQGNYRYLIEKAMGDALVAGGWLDDDDWDRFEFGGLARTYEKGVSWTRLILFPTAHESQAAA